jgi:hypothetical protein
MRGIFLMKDLASVEEAVGLGAKIYDGVSPFNLPDNYRYLVGIL